MPVGAIVGGVSAVAGAIGGGKGKKSKSQLILPPETQAELDALGLRSDALEGLQELFQAQGGLGTVKESKKANREFAGQLRQLSRTGGLPTQEDITMAQGFAEQVFRPEQLQLEQGFVEQGQRTSQLAARLGRPVNDPILQAKLAQSQINQQAVLAARQGAFAADIAQQQPERKLGFFRERAGFQQGLASQAIANRQALFSMGNQITASEREFRLRQAGEQKTEGGGLLGALAGGLGGASAGISAGSSISNIFKGGSGGNSAGQGDDLSNIG